MVGVNKKIIEIALHRGVLEGDLESFLFPEKSKLKDSFLLPGIKEAVKKISEYIEKNEKIVIYGDYDADGITSTALLWKAIKKVYTNIHYYIPQRDGEGYGLNSVALDLISSQGSALVITVDCGIKSYQLVKDFSAKGLEFIITDHHTPDELLPDAIIVNPKQSGPKEFFDLAGVGVAFQLAMALSTDYPEIKAVESDLFQLAALGTIADLVPLQFENRIIVKKGIIELNRNPILGIKALVDKNKITEINSKTIAFLLAPIINSSGRMENPEIALKLLISEDLDEIGELADQLITLNFKRKVLVGKIYKEAQKKILENHYFLDPFILVEDKDWAAGVLGIVASKLMNEYHRPIMVLSESAEGLFKGSARSIDHYNLFQGLKKQESLLEEFGGHAQAAGLSIRKENIDKLRVELKLDVYKNLNKNDFINELSPDLKLNGINEITMELYNDLALLEPFGTGNPDPIFTFKEPVDLKLSKIGKLKDHLRVDITQNKQKMKGIYFNFQEYFDGSFESNLVFSVGVNEWQNKTSLQLEIKKITGGEKILSQKIEQKVYSNLLFHKGNEGKTITFIEKIKYNEICSVFEDTRAILHFSEDQNQMLANLNKSNANSYLYDINRDFTDNFKDVKEFITRKDKKVLFSNVLLIKEEILAHVDKFVFLSKNPFNNTLLNIKEKNPNISIYVVDPDHDAQKIPDRKMLSQLYVLIKNNFHPESCSEITSFLNKCSSSMGVDFTIKDLLFGIMVFEELGFLEYSFKNSFLEIKVNNHVEKNDLENSKLYYNLLQNYQDNLNYR